MFAFVITFVSLAIIAVVAYVAKAAWLSAVCLVVLALLSFRFALRVKRYTCVVCASACYETLPGATSVVPCASCNSWLLIALDNGAPLIKDHVSKTNFDEWIAYAGSRMAALQALERKWGTAPTELANARVIAERDASKPTESSEVMDTILRLLGFVLAVALVGGVVWVTVTLVRKAWDNPLF